MLLNEICDPRIERDVTGHSRRAETRFALGVIYPAAICLVNLTDAA
jgi:hypothetical protein